MTDKAGTPLLPSVTSSSGSAESLRWTASLSIIPRGQIFGLIGPNGAGKTTLFNCLSRLYTPTSGEITFEGASILDKPPHLMSDVGIGRTFQNVALFPNLTVMENILVGGHSKSRGDAISNALTLPWVRREEEKLRAAAQEAIDYLDLGSVADRVVAGLPFGTRSAWSWRVR